MAKKRRSDGGKHKAPRRMVPLPKDVIDALRGWCQANRRVMAWEIAEMIRQFLREQGAWTDEPKGEE
jgi:hypothetical protein